jgi:cytochrome c5
MKRTIFVMCAVGLVWSCKPKKEITSSNAGPTDKQFAAAKARFPDVTMDQLKKGQNLYSTACTKCHGAKDVTPYTEDKLSAIMDNMAEKAQLSADEKTAVWRYAIAVRSAK